MNIKLTYFFRKQNPNFHSIEYLFDSIIDNLPQEITANKIYLPFHTGFLGRIKNILFAKKNKNQINHITGDINYIALGLPKKNTVLTIHDIGSALSGNKLKKIIIKLFWFSLPLKRVSKITVISEFSKKEILNNFIIDENKIIVVPNCISKKFFNLKKQHNDFPKTILFIGTKKNKNLERSITALNGLNIKLIIVGKLSENQLNLLQENNIDYETYFNLPQKDLIELFKKSDILLFPSLYEGFGMPIIEAQAAGLAVITSDIEPLKTTSGNAAVFVNPYKIDEIKNAVIYLQNNPETLTNLIIKGYENVQNFSCENIAKKYAEIYKSMIISE